MEMSLRHEPVGRLALLASYIVSQTHPAGLARMADYFDFVAREPTTQELGTSVLPGLFS